MCDEHIAGIHHVTVNRIKSLASSAVIMWLKHCAQKRESDWAMNINTQEWHDDEECGKFPSFFFLRFHWKGSLTPKPIATFCRIISPPPPRVPHSSKLRLHDALFSSSSSLSRSKQRGRIFSSFTPVSPFHRRAPRHASSSHHHHFVRCEDENWTLKKKRRRWRWREGEEEAVEVFSCEFSR